MLKLVLSTMRSWHVSGSLVNTGRSLQPESATYKTISEIELFLRFKSREFIYSLQTLRKVNKYIRIDSFPYQVDSVLN